MSRFTLLLACALCALCVLPAQVRAQEAAAAPDDSGQTYLKMQVDKEAKLRSGGAPEYPSSLRLARVTGEVLVQFIVDERGRPQMDSFQVLRSSNMQFTDAVRRAVRVMTFFPAEINGQKVKQLVQVPFKFNPGG